MAGSRSGTPRKRTPREEPTPSQRARMTEEKLKAIAERRREQNSIGPGTYDVRPSVFLRGRETDRTRPSAAFKSRTDTSTAPSSAPRSLS